jgi:hypothetical protein
VRLGVIALLTAAVLALGAGASARPAAMRVVALGPTSARVLSPGRVEYGTNAALGLWSRPARRGSATLTGLLPNTRYLVRSAAGSTAFTTPAAGATVTRVGAGGKILLNGSPFFPLMQWLQCPSLFAQNVSLGINLFLGRGCDSGSDREEVDDLARLGAYSVLPFDASVKARPGLFGWHFDDEPDGNEIRPAQVLATYRRNRAADRRHLNFLTVTSGFYSERDAPGWMNGDRSYYRAYARATDLAGFDLYPVTGWCRPDWLPQVGGAQRELRGYAGTKPTYQWIEAISTSSRWCHGRGVTAAELRAETWLAIANGAKAIGYFTHSWKPDYSQFRVSPAVQRQMRVTNRQITTLAPALLAPAISATCPAGLACKATTFHGARYLLAVNPSRAPVRGALRLSGEGHVVRIFGTAARRAVVGGSFSDSLPALSTRIYIAPPR